MDCIFCKIIDDSIPSHKIYENEKIAAFLDILPIHPGHTIVAPKSHIADLENLPDEDLTAMILAVKKIGKSMIENLGVKGYSVFLDNKSAANQHVPHAHFHIVPRVEGDGLERWPQSGYEEGEAEVYVKRIQKSL